MTNTAKKSEQKAANPIEDGRSMSRHLSTENRPKSTEKSSTRLTQALQGAHKDAVSQWVAMCKDERMGTHVRKFEIISGVMMIEVEGWLS